jgi:hypothetical protein
MDREEMQRRGRAQDDEAGEMMRESKKWRLPAVLERSLLSHAFAATPRAAVAEARPLNFQYHTLAFSNQEPWRVAMAHQISKKAFPENAVNPRLINTSRHQAGE